MRVVLLLLLVGCSASDGGSERRLHRRYWIYEDGMQQLDPHAFWDTELEAECTPQKWSDGHMYCTPLTSAIAYTDSNCESAVARVALDAEAPEFLLRVYELDTTKVPSRLYRRGEPRNAPTAVWLFDGAECTGPLAAEGALFFDVTAIDPVRVFETEPTGTARLRLSMLETAEGLRVPLALHDTLAESACVPMLADDGTTSCIPTTVANAPVFRDDACTQRLAMAVDSPSPPLVVRVEGSAAECPAYYQRGSWVLNSPVFQQFGAQCAPIELSDTQLTYTIAEPFPLASMQRRLGDGARLHTVELSDSDLVVADAELYDTQLDVACQPAQLDDRVRCIPAMPDVNFGYYYPTSACEEPTKFLEIERRACEPAPRFVVQRTQSQYLIHAVGDRYRDPVYIRTNGVDCVPTQPNVELHVPGAVTGTEIFVSARRQ